MEQAFQNFIFQKIMGFLKVPQIMYFHQKFSAISYTCMNRREVVYEHEYNKM